MRAMRRLGTTAGLVIMALLPVAAAVSAEPATTAAAPVAIVHPIAAFRVGSGAILPESGLLILIGTGLLGLAAIVRRATRA
jgi:hypothetical protein